MAKFSKKRELIILLFCLLGALLLDLAGMNLYPAHAKAFLKQFVEILLLTIVFYVAVVVLKVIYILISRVWFRK